jgi:hypothetical protein
MNSNVGFMFDVVFTQHFAYAFNNEDKALGFIVADRNCRFPAVHVARILPTAASGFGAAQGSSGAR